MGWPRAQFRRVVLFGVRECLLRALFADIRGLLVHLGRAQQTTRPIEAMRSKVTDRTRQPKSGALCRVGRWRHLVASRAAEESDRPKPPAHAVAQCAARALTIAASTFDARGHTPSYDEDRTKKFRVSKALRW